MKFKLRNNNTYAYCEVKMFLLYVIFQIINIFFNNLSIVSRVSEQEVNKLRDFAIQVPLCILTIKQCNGAVAHHYVSVLVFKEKSLGKPALTPLGTKMMCKLIKTVGVLTLTDCTKRTAAKLPLVP